MKKLMSVIIACAVMASPTTFAKDTNLKETRNKTRLVKSEVIGDANKDFGRRFPGKVRAVQRVNMAFQVHGIIKELNVKEGEKVEIGQVLARLDNRDFKNNLAATKAKLEEVRLNYNRSKKLYKQQVIAKAKYDEVKAALEALEANTKILEKQLADTRLEAPFSGVIAKRYVQNHENITAKAPILSLQDNTAIEIVIQIPESLMIKGVEKKFANSVVIFDAAPERKYPAKLSEASTDADPYSQTYSVVLKMQSPEDLNVLPGMTATVEIPEESKSTQEPITVELSAVFANSNNVNQVWRIKSDNTLELVQVEIGTIIGNKIEIKSGLSRGDRVVIAGVNLLKQGDKVRELER
ncbi:MAG: efflux RND transporter periplasmic adaptor subunit [Gammaproteobacteria bacterium]|nr:MAG: efflux RND transporter periplasmic adaptor subunit [Gammaproteobacteria bacterium]